MGIVRCREVLHGQNCIYHILDYAGEQSLDRLLERRLPLGCLEPDETDSCFIQIGSGLWHCHERRLSHRSVSPHHVVVSLRNNGELKCTLVDFRSALSANDGQMGQMQHGKMPYMAPEMMASLPHHPLRVDCWSLGAVVLECIVGHDALAYALQWDGQIDPSEETAIAVRESLGELGAPSKIVARLR